MFRDADGEKEVKFLYKLIAKDQFRFAPDPMDKEHGVAIHDFVIVDAAGKLRSLVDLDVDGVDLFLHGVVTSWEKDGGIGWVVGNVPVDEW